MSGGIYTAVAGAVAQSEALDVTANNVANATTAGFRAERVAFHQVMSRADGTSMAFVGATGGRTDVSQGALRQTGGALDVALVGDGYLGVETSQGVRYTRAGSLRTDANGTLVTAAGQPVRAAGGGTVSIPPGAQAIVIGADGTVEVDGAAVGALELVQLEPGQVARVGDNLFEATGQARPAGPEVEVVSGALEQANFDLVRGVVDLVRVSRNYEALHRMIERYQDIDARTARDLGGPG